MGLITVMVFVAGVGGVVAGGVVLAGTIAEYSGCVDECHGALVWGSGGLLLIVLGALLLMVATALLSQLRHCNRDEIDRELGELRARMPRD